MRSKRELSDAEIAELCDVSRALYGGSDASPKETFPLMYVRPYKKGRQK